VVVVVVVVLVVVVIGSQQSMTGHFPSFLTTSTFPSGHLSWHSHSKIGQLLSLSIPEQIKVQQSSHLGSGRGLQIVVLQPHSSSDSTSISQGLHCWILISGHCFSTHSYSAGQQHSVPSAKHLTCLSWHLLHLTSSTILGQEISISFSSQHSHGVSQ
jgi:hypothetical protein